MAKLNDDDVLALIEAEEQVAYGSNDAELAAERKQAIDYYLGKPLGNEVEGRSQVVSTDVADTIESLLPALLKVFVSGDEVVRFDARDADDIEAAEQETEAVNYVVMEKNPGFQLFYTWFKDALLSKNGYVKAYWEEREEVEKEFYSGLTDEEFAMLVDDDEVEVVEHTAYPDEIDAKQREQAIQQQPQMAKQINSMPPKMLHDVRVQTKQKYGCVEFKNVPPESIKVSEDTFTVSVQNSRFVQHSEYVSIDELREQGFDVPDDVGYDDNELMQQESLSRDIYNERMNRLESSGAERMVTARDTYIRINGELKRYVVVGRTIIHQEDAEIIPFAVVTPIIMPHRHIGRSMVDMTIDVAQIKTALHRGILDAMYVGLNPRHFVSDRVNLDDMLVSRPNGLVRVSGNDISTAAMPIVTPDVSQMAYPMLSYMDSIKENRTGVTKYNQGMDADSLNKTATGISRIMDASQQRSELIARIFAEGGVKELFMLTHRLMRTHSHKEMVLRLRDKWVAVDPREWKTRYSMSVSVGLGTGNKDQMLGHLITILQAQKEGMQIGLATPKNIYNALAKMTQNAGFKNPEEFWTDPSEQPVQPPEPPQPSPDTLATNQAGIAMTQIKAQSDQAIAHEKHMLDYDAKLKIAQMNYQIDAAKMNQDDVLSQRNYVLDSIKTIVDTCVKQHIDNIPKPQLPVIDPKEPKIADVAGVVNKLHDHIVKQQAKPEPIVIQRGPDGRAVSVGGRKVIRDETGRILSLH